ncbi:MAG: hypothetical protein RBT71_04535 [Flavobacteriales bacterium]|jgi:hypothetical protein|nr:hypothetical protein [Flavobacteriales bacterium]
MSDRTPFDDLARRKLNERGFPVPPGAWESMEQQLDAHAPRRGRRAWPLLLLLPIGWAAWHFTRPDAPAHAPEIAERPHTPPAAEAPAPATAPMPARMDPIAMRSAEAPATTAPAHDAGRTSTGNDAHAPAPMPAPARAAVAQDRHAPAADRPSSGKAITSIPVGTITATDRRSRPGSEDLPPAPTMEPATDTTSPIAEGRIEDDIAPSGSAAVPEHVPALAPLADQVAGAEPAETDPMPPAEPEQAPHIDPVPPTVYRDTLAPVVDDATTVPAVGLSAPDSMERAAPAYPVLEATAWAALYHTATRYTGPRAEHWATDHAAGTTFGFGAELMRMGSRFGVGVGLQYSTYAEDMRAQDMRHSWSEQVAHHQLHGIDTTWTIVTGTTVIDGQTYYVTQTVDTTLLVLVTTTSTEVHDEVRRNALQRMNRTSYLEVPLLLDVHATTGRWHFGVRGGPMLGVLQGRRGVLPGATGYIDMRDAAFSALVLGWTAQGQVRYRIAGGWSIGAGPAARGQLLNTMQGDGLVRRSMAWGGQFGISHTFR